jgi:FixJ family two-component response regulator
MMLTGNADQKTAIDAVNDGNIFRFITKPCQSKLLINSIDAALEQSRLIHAQKKLL